MSAVKIWGVSSERIKSGFKRKVMINQALVKQNLTKKQANCIICIHFK
jgi:hypothetical protein